MITHELKCWPDFFDAIASGRKPFEVRKNDRGYQAGDRLILRKWDPNGVNGPSYVDKHGYNIGRGASDLAASVTVEVTYVLSGWGIEPGYVVMGLANMSDERGPQ
jgi:hypothetical protein